MSSVASQSKIVSSFHELVDFPFQGVVNSACWHRTLNGNFSEIVSLLDSHQQNINVIEIDELLKLPLSEDGKLAVQQIVSDFNSLSDFGADPVLNLIRHYEQDVDNPPFPTDVYSWHVDRAPFVSSTFLCTYYGPASEIIPNAHVEQKILVPDIRIELRKLFGGNDTDFDAFLEENFYDLHYRAISDAQITNLGNGHLWRLACDSPDSACLPCVHRAPLEKKGEVRLMMIC